MSIFYVRPAGAHSNTQNGLSYDTAWLGWSNITWGTLGVGPSSTLYVCGSHTYSSVTTIGNHTATSLVTAVSIRGDYYREAGSISLSGNVYINSRPYTKFIKLKVVGGINACMYAYDPTGVTIDGCDISGGVMGLSLGGSVSASDLTVINNTIHDILGTASNGNGVACMLSTAGVSFTNVNISNNHIYNCPSSSVRCSIESAAVNTAAFYKLTAENNNIHDCGGPFWFRAGPPDTTTLPSTYSENLVLRRNTIKRCGTAAGPNGFHGSIAVSGFINPLIEYNTLYDNYVTGAGIQTAKNINIRIRYNDIRRIRSGTPTSQFQNGFPIDGNGIFLDNLTQSGVAYGNYIEDLISTGLTNSGTGLSFWDGVNGTFIGNVVVNCYRGASYGSSTEGNNAIYNNTFINCNIGVSKVGTVQLLSNVKCKNNIFINCATGFNIGANPSIDEDYNIIYGSTTNYVGISQGLNSVTNVDPMLNEFHASLNSALHGTGVYTGVLSATDFRGRRFRSPPTPGAIEGRPVAILAR